MLKRSYISGHEGHSHYFTNSQIGLLSKSVDFSLEEVELMKIIKNLSDPTKLKIYLLLNKVEEFENFPAEQDLVSPDNFEFVSDFDIRISNLDFIPK